MTVGTLERTTPPLVERRCRCLRCGAHLMGVVGAATLGGRCSTCSSYEVVPLAVAVATGHATLKAASI